MIRAAPLSATNKRENKMETVSQREGKAHSLLRPATLQRGDSSRAATVELLLMLLLALDSELSATHGSSEHALEQGEVFWARGEQHTTTVL